MKIYTKKGDAGSTFLFGGGPYPKDTPRICVYGEVDELNSILGSALSEETNEKLKQLLLETQKQLFVLGSELASVNPGSKLQAGFLKMKHIEKMEKEIDQMEGELTPLKHFILPGGGKPSALLHLARTVCRRAERGLVSLSHTETLRSEILIYLNRLSDFLFVMARYSNLKAGIKDVLWEGILT